MRPSIRTVLALSLAMLVPVGMLNAAPLDEDPAVQRQMLAGLRDVAEFKASLSAAEKKLDAALVLRIRSESGGDVPASLRMAPSGAQSRTSAPTMAVYQIRAADLARVAEAIHALGGQVRVVETREGILTAQLPDDALLTLAARADVEEITIPVEPIPQALSDVSRAHAGIIDGLGDPAANPASDGSGVTIAVISVAADPTDIIEAVDEGELLQGQLTFVNWAQRDNPGDPICLTAGTDGVSACTATDIAKWVTVPAACQDPNDAGHPCAANNEWETDSVVGAAPVSAAWAYSDSGSSSKKLDGVAMLQLIHDVAPGANLQFTSPSSDGLLPDGASGMVTAIRALTSPAADGESRPASLPVPDVIVDDLFFFDQSPFQDDVVAAAAEEAVAAGITYLAAAGDFGNVASTTPGGDNFGATLEEDFLAAQPVNTCESIPGLTPTELQQCNDDYAFFIEFGDLRVHDFGLSSLEIELREDLAQVCLFWSEARGSVSTNYDLLVFGPNGDWRGLGDNFGFSEAKECLSETSPSTGVLTSGNKLVITVPNADSGRARMLHLSALRVADLDPADATTSRQALEKTSAGTIRGQAAAAGVVAVGAVNVPARVIDATDEAAFYSSDGHRRVFFDSAGQLLGPANDFSSSGGVERFKPDVVAGDGVSLSLPDGQAGLASPMTARGTSVSAAHAAGLVALLLQDQGGGDVPPSEMLQALQSSAIDIGPPTQTTPAVRPDEASGWGAISLSATTSALALPMPVGSFAVTGGPARVVLSFDAPDDDQPDFVFEVLCADSITTPVDVFVETTAGGVGDAEATRTTRYAVPLSPGQTAECRVVAVDTGDSSSGPASEGSATASALDAPASVSLTPLVGGVQLTYPAAAGDNADAQLAGIVYEYTPACLEWTDSEDPNVDAGAAITLTPALAPDQDRNLVVLPGNQVRCEVEAAAQLAGPPVVDLTAGPTVSSVVSSASAQPDVTVQSDSGGISLRYVLGGSITTLADPGILQVGVICQPAPGTTADPITVASLAEQGQDFELGRNYFVPIETEGEWNCSAVTTITVGSGQGASSVENTSAIPGGPFTVEEIISGLPIWLLYQATQATQP